METHESPYDPAAALADVAIGREAAARRVATPWWYHPLLGLAVAVMVGGMSRGASGLVTGLGLLALGLLLVLYRRLTGLWLNLWHVPGMRRPAMLATAVTYAVLLAGALLEHVAGVPWALVVTGAVLGVAYVVFWRWVERRVAALWRQGA